MGSTAQAPKQSSPVGDPGAPSSMVWLATTAGLAFTAAAVPPDGWRRALTLVLVALACVLGPVVYSRWHKFAGIAVAVVLLTAGGAVAIWPVETGRAKAEATSSSSPSFDPSQASVPDAPSGPGGRTSCLPVGVGVPGYETAFRAAFESHGGAARLGCAINRVTQVEGGFHQNFWGRDGLSAIFATDPERALVLHGKYHAAFRAIGGGDGMRSVGLGGYPLDEGNEVAGGSMLTVGAGGFQTSGVVRKKGGAWIWVPPIIWDTYMKHFGGPTGAMGFPVSLAEPIGNTAELKQSFERGALCTREVTAYRC